jgi:hypothetical protein
MRRWLNRLAGVVMSVMLFSLPSLLKAQTIPYVVVERIGGDANYGGSATAATSAATAVFFDRFSPFTASQSLPSPLPSLAMPTAQGTLAVTDSGVAASDGQFTRFVNGAGFAVAGFDANLGTASVASSNPATTSRTVGAISPGFAVNTSTGFNNGPSNNFRSAATVDGSAFWASTAGTATAPGMLYVSTLGSVNNATTIANGNYRVTRIFNNSLFASSASATPGLGISLIGSAGALPTSITSTTLLPGTGGTGSSNYGFYLFNNPLNANNWNATGLNTLYVADDRVAASGGGLLRYVFDGANWNLSATAAYTLDNNAGGLRGLTATIDLGGPSPVVHLWGTSTGLATGANQNDLVQIDDTLSAVGGTFGSFNTLATSPTNTFFRGVEFAAIPEPTTVALIVATISGIGIFAYSRFVRRKRLLKALGYVEE